MPYRLKPSDKKVIQVKTPGGWVDKYTHKSQKEAQGQLYVLNKKVGKKHA